MTEQEKMMSIAESLDMEVEELSEEQVLDELENWDSVAVLSIIATINEKFDKYPHANDVLKCQTIKDLMELMQ